MNLQTNRNLTRHNENIGRPRGFDKDKMPFGKHKGEPISSIDVFYLQWVLNTVMGLSPDLRGRIERSILDTLARHKSE